MDFTCRENIDGSFEVYNTKIGDIYFSNVGAYKEALEKFVLPSLPVLKNKSEIKILDACYGLGYNSKTFLNYLYQNNIKIKTDILAVDIDENILTLGLFIFDKNISDCIHKNLGREILSSINFDKNIEKILGENWIKLFLPQVCAKFEQDFQNSGVYLYQKDKISTFLHNIYYQNQLNFEKFFNLDLKIEKLEEILPKIDFGVDLIFHDAFSILKQPELWSEEIMQRYYEILNPNGRLLTYSNSRVLRKRLDKIGFAVEINFDNNGKQNGTIAIKT